MRSPFDASTSSSTSGSPARAISPIGSVVVGTEAVYRDLSAEWPVVDRVTPDAGLVERVRVALPDAAAAPIHTSAAVGASR